ncbi:hypothetical protein EPR50_G00198410 [Perca flavescens]|uniref:Uncharacterized protein n=1 Tax=Perca flavescens TaxID=8167 RepID=A0A484CDP0_PERFV|nr:hypothetical protein EPR50_G00198410 [Perca flavescens]
MAEAALSRSRAAAGGLYFLLTLLGLVCLTSSLVDNKKLENMMESLKEARQNLEKLKAEKDTPPELISEYMSFMEPMMEFSKRLSKYLPDDFPPMDGLMENIKGFMEKTKTYVDRENVKMDAKIAKLEKNLENVEKIIKALKGYQAEL